jgi:hypothetical protein
VPALVFQLPQSRVVVERAFHPLNSLILQCFSAFFQGRDGLSHQGAAVALRFVPRTDAVNHVKTPNCRGVGYLSGIVVCVDHCAEKWNVEHSFMWLSCGVQRIFRCRCERVDACNVPFTQLHQTRLQTPLLLKSGPRSISSHFSLSTYSAPSPAVPAAFTANELLSLSLAL